MNEKRRISENEIVPRGEEIYEREIRARLGVEDEGKFVVVDIESGSFAVSEDDNEAFEVMEERRPGAVFFVLRVGRGGESYPAYSFGFHR